MDSSEDKRPRHVRHSLRLLLADERQDVLEKTAEIVEELGHQVVARVTGLDTTVDAAQKNDADLALVAVHHPAHALDQVEQLNDTAGCPVVLVLDGDDPQIVRQAAERGIISYANEHAPAAIETAIALAVAVFEDLQGHGRETHEPTPGVTRRTLIERAKGVLMERHNIDEAQAYTMLRARARQSRERLVDVAQAVLTARPLLAPAQQERAQATGDDQRSSA